MKHLFRIVLATIITFSFATLSHAQTVILAPISTNTTWAAANGPFLVGIPVTIQSGATLTIEPGTVVKFTDQSAGIEVQTGATLSAQGTSGSPIYFTSFSDDIGGDTNGNGSATTPENRQWARIINFGTLNLAHTTVRYGGYIAGGLSLRSGSVTTLNNATVHHMGSDGISLIGGTLTATSSTISNNGKGLDQSGGTATFSLSTFLSNTQGFEVQGTSTALSLTNNTFTDNGALGALPSFGTFTHTGNTATGGALDGFQISGAVTNSRTLTESDVPYIVNGVLTVQSGGELILNAGATLKFRDTDSGLEILSGGILNGNGTTAKPITFTALTGTTDRHWKRILNRGSLTLSHAIISHGGFTAGGLTTTAGSFTTLDHVTLSQMGSDGISNAGVTTITNTTVTGNSKGIEVTDGTLSINYSAIYGNSSGLENGTSAPVDATYNWWGHASGPSHTNNPSGIGNSVSGNVDFTPFFTSLSELSVVKKFKIAVILAEPYDVHHISSEITDQPCKLKPQKTYPNGHDASYYNDLFHCASAYYREVSKGTIDLQFKIFDNNGEWYRVTDPSKTKNYYKEEHASELIDDILGSVNSYTQEEYDAVLVKYSTNSGAQYIEVQAFPIAHGHTTSHSIISAETSEVGIDIHELGHVIGGLSTHLQTFVPDLYKMGLSSRNPLNVNSAEDSHGAFDVMAEGNANDLGKTPSLMSSFTQEFLGLLQYSIYKKSDYPTFWVTALGQYSYKDAVPRYNLSESTSADASRFYIIEHRNRTVSRWESALPGTLNTYAPIYYVNTFGNDKHGYSFLGNLYVSKWMVAIPSNGILSTDNPTYTDLNNLVKFSLVGARSQDGKKQLQIMVSAVPPSTLDQKRNGSVLIPSENSFIKQSGFFYFQPPNPVHFLLPYIRDFFHFMLCFTFVALMWSAIYVVRKKNPSFKKTLFYRLTKIAKVVLVIVFLAYGYVIFVNQFVIREGDECYYVNRSIIRYKNYPKSCQHFYPFYAPSESDLQPDLDLHAITPDGRHVGMNYTTGEYENQIAGSIVSGDNQGIHEWIFVPEGETVRYYVSAQDNQGFVEQNPTLTNKTDTFDIYSRTIDPATGIFTSEVLTNQAIEPTEQRTFELSGTTESPTVSATHALTVTADNQRIPFGADIPALSYTLAGFEEGDTIASSTSGSIACTTTATSTSPVGTYPILCTRGDFASEDYAIASYSSGTLTIAPTLTITADNVTIPQGADIPTLTATISGFINEDTAESATTGVPDCTTTATNISPAGNYPIICAIGTLASDTYIVTTYVDGIITILPQLTVTADDKVITEGNTIPTLTSSVTGFLNGDTQASSTTGSPECTTTATQSSPPGVYPITCTAGTLTSNTYALTTFIDGTLTIEPAVVIRPLTVTAQNKTIVQGNALPALTYTLSGFVNGDTQASATTGQPACTTTATVSSPVGTYPITCTEGTFASATYTIATYTDAVLTITDGTPPELQTRFDQTLKDTVLSALDSVDEQPTIAHSGNTITLTDSSNNVTTINLTKYKESSTKLKLTYNSITRNGITTSVPNTTIMYDWSLNWLGQLKDLDSKVTIHGVERYTFTYNRLKDETKIKTKVNNTTTTTTRDGFVSPVVVTHGGGVIVSY